MVTYMKSLIIVILAISGIVHAESMLIKNAKNQTFLPPRIVNIAMINEAAEKAEGEDGEQIESLEITKVIDPQAFDMDLKNFVLRELSMGQQPV